MGPGDLEKILSKLPQENSPRILSRIDQGEDAGVFLLRDDLAIVQTLDFFPPMVDDPFTFGQIAAANALSDIYAMGGLPLTAMNIVGFPCSLDMEILEEILKGGYSKVHEAGAVMLGGHTIDDEEPKYGLSVTGKVDPENIKTVEGAHAGDMIILTKPIGTGILTTALKAEFITESEISDTIDSMRTLNRESSEILFRYSVNACTDVTGFGLIGHLHDILAASGVSCELWAGKVPLFEKTLEMASMGMIPAGLYRNRNHYKKWETCAGEIDPLLFESLYDPQTSGGLLAIVPTENAKDLLNELRSGPCPRAEAVGIIAKGPEPHVVTKQEGVSL
ncbi:MAG: selenide, water dikinase SelD [Actinobacteria bacterium]|nr:selenide, water dikinase SelD [Actinomycetota bacterium]